MLLGDTNSSVSLLLSSSCFTESLLTLKMVLEKHALAFLVCTFQSLRCSLVPAELPPPHGGPVAMLSPEEAVSEKVIRSWELQVGLERCRGLHL